MPVEAPPPWCSESASSVYLIESLESAEIP